MIGNIPTFADVIRSNREEHAARVIAAIERHQAQESLVTYAVMAASRRKVATYQRGTK